MAIEAEDNEGLQIPSKRIQIYSTTNTGVSPFWRDKYERDAKKYWDIFYKKHQDRFFKDRHYLDKEWGSYFSGTGRKVILEVGCGAGNTTFPLVTTYPDAFVYACDFSPRAVELVKTHKEFTEARIRAFVCDLTVDDLSKEIPQYSVDIVTMIFVLSAVSPENMPLVLQNIRRVLKPNGYVLFRDYATGDLAQERFTSKDQKISDNFYVRGDGTRAYYFSNEFLMDLCKENGFNVKEIGVCCKQVENRSRELVMNRRWVQAVFYMTNGGDYSNKEDAAPEANYLGPEIVVKAENTLKAPLNNSEVDISEGVAIDMFGISPSIDNEIIEINLRNWYFKIRVLSKEYQHTCKSTGLMLWESARLMASILSGNSTIVAGKKVLELGCGCAGICSMVATKSADLVFATDVDECAIDLLNQNVTSNLEPSLLAKLTTKRLEWGNRDHIEAIKEVNNKGFDIIMGTDVTYVPEAIVPLFATAKELIVSGGSSKDNKEPALILCHVFRRVDEPSLLSTAAQFGFRLADKWSAGVSSNNSLGIIHGWFSDDSLAVPSTALNILLFFKE